MITKGTAFGVFAVIYGVIFLVSLAFSAVTYILQSLGLYTVAKRRGINNPWLAWLPIGNVWILGSIQICIRQKQKIRQETAESCFCGLI